MSEFKLGLRANRNQFVLLVMVNAFVGAMVGLERSVFPSLAKEQFGLDSAAVILSFIVVFGLVKAGANYYAGALSDKLGRKKILLIGWLFAIPVPFIIRYAPSWNWIVVANIFLGINQGLAWSSTVIMKIDLVGPKRRGLAMGVNEFAGYIAVALMAFFTAKLASEYGLREVPFLIGVVVVTVGLLATILFVQDTRKFVTLESTQSSLAIQNRPFLETTFLNRNLSAITQAGMVNNLNDGMIWGLLPLLMLQFKFDLDQIAWAAGLYPAVWGIGQLFTGAWGDKVSKKKLLVAGMLLQGVVLVILSKTASYELILVLSALLGFGTALVYPNFLSGISEHTHPNDRAKSIGVFRLWRDSGYAIGAILSGIIAQFWGISAAILIIGCITVLSSIVIQVRME